MDEHMHIFVKILIFLKYKSHSRQKIVKQRDKNCLNKAKFPQIVF